MLVAKVFQQTSAFAQLKYASLGYVLNFCIFELCRVMIVICFPILENYGIINLQWSVLFRVNVFLQ